MIYKYNNIFLNIKLNNINFINFINNIIFFFNNSFIIKFIQGLFLQYFIWIFYKINLGTAITHKYNFTGELQKKIVVHLIVEIQDGLIMILILTIFLLQWLLYLLRQLWKDGLIICFNLQMLLLKVQ